MKRLFIIPVLFIMLMIQGCLAGEQNSADNTTSPAQTAVVQSNTETDSNKLVFATNKLEFSFPNDWKLNDKENPFDLQCFSRFKDFTTGVYVYDKMDIAEGGSAEDKLDYHIDNIQSIRENFKLIEVTKDIDTGDKRIKTIVYSGEKDSEKNYYVFSLVEFKEFEKFAVILQTCVPSNFEKNKSTLDEIVSSCRTTE